jgi:hypothetical protein
LTIENFSIGGSGFVGIGTGVATVNGTGGLGHLNTLGLSDGIAVSGTIPFTDPQIPTLLSTRLNAGIGAGVLRPISGGPPLTQNTLPVQGTMKVCILFPSDCLYYLPISLTMGGTRGIGIGGGLITVNTFSKGAGLKLSVQGAPWTIGLASIRNVTTETPNGGITTYTRTAQGFVHGPASATSSTAGLSGVVQLVTPFLVQSSLGAPDTYGGYFATLTLHFVPEPSTILLFGAGVAAFGMLGRRHTKK